MSIQFTFNTTTTIEAIGYSDLNFTKPNTANTVSFWFNASGNASSGGLSVPFNYRTPSGNVPTMWEFFFNDAGTMEYRVRDNAGLLASTGVSTATFSTNVWNHCAGVRNGDNLEIFLNGTSVATDNSVALGTLTQSTTFEIGKQAGTTNNFGFIGQLAEFTVHDAALTDNEVAAMAAGCHPLRVRRSVLLFYAPLWEIALDGEMSGRDMAETPVNTPSDGATNPPIEPYMRRQTRVPMFVKKTTRVKVPIDIRTPDFSGDSHYADVANTAFLPPGWAFNPDVDAGVFGIVSVPKTMVPGCKNIITIDTMVNAIVNITSWSVRVARVADGESYDVSTMRLQEIKDVLAPDTLEKRRRVAFELIGAINPDEELMVEIRHEGLRTEDTQTVESFFENAYLEVTVEDSV